jgi:2-oxoglutarate dehydrogenase E1 component
MMLARKRKLPRDKGQSLHWNPRKVLTFGMSTQHAQLIDSSNLHFIEALYQQFQQDPSSVPYDWQDYFRQFNGYAASPMEHNVPMPPEQAPVEEAPRACGGADVQAPRGGSRCQICGREEQMATLQQRVDKLIRNFRVRGHRAATLDPLGRPGIELPELDPAYHGLSENYLDRPFLTENFDENKRLPLRDIIRCLRETYCRSIGVQFMHIDDLAVREWLQQRMERTCNRIQLDRNEQLRILTKLTDAVIMEEFIQKKFTGAKRFSLEGAESLIPLLDLAIEKAGQQGVREIVLGMAHRGRLNVLANIMGKRPEQIFREFEDANAHNLRGGGDVKYHLGFHNDWITSTGADIHLALCFNPSHLEYVNTVAMGRVRAKQDRLGDFERSQSMLILVHGDAAFMGEGVVQETLNLSQLEGYRIGGALHIIVNNQIGFTTPPEDGRSSVYASDIAKMLQSPIFHVNGESPEAVAQAILLSMEFRETFKRDVVIDMYCYRRWGHNEGDEPAFTQPMLYKAISERKPVRDGYLEHLLELGEVSREEADEIEERRTHELEEQLNAAKGEAQPQPISRRNSILGRIWKQYEGGFDLDVPDVDTGIEKERLQDLLRRLTVLPDDFRPHPKIKRLLKQRAEIAEGKRPVDWSAAEALAFATLAAEGARVRMSGQDSRRGTFSHRHAALYDFEDGHIHMPLQHVTEDQAPVEIFNSPLSEVGVLGFEYGYSIAYPDGLVMWEAQFGDFANCAQVLIDQGITSAEDKWKSLSGIVLMLPHGFEGMGPEHSSARLERFLMLSAEDNIQVANPTTPAQIFHLLRRQVVRPWRKPLVIMTPKSLLRHPKVVSTFDDLAEGPFQRIIPDQLDGERKINRVLLCSGKIYYELAQKREEEERDDVAILRVEQLYPLQEKVILEALAPYDEETEVVWVQEEPENMGVWLHLRARFCNRLAGKWPLRGVTRASSASPATGSMAAHKLEQQELIERAFA